MWEKVIIALVLTHIQIHLESCFYEVMRKNLTCFAVLLLGLLTL